MIVTLHSIQCGSSSTNCGCGRSTHKPAGTSKHMGRATGLIVGAHVDGFHAPRLPLHYCRAFRASLAQSRWRRRTHPARDAAQSRAMDPRTGAGAATQIIRGASAPADPHEIVARIGNRLITSSYCSFGESCSIAARSARDAATHANTAPKSLKRRTSASGSLRSRAASRQLWPLLQHLPLLGVAWLHFLPGALRGSR